LIWYGFKTYKWKNKIRNLKLENKLKVKSLTIRFFNKINLNKNIIFFYCPPNWNLIIFSFKIKFDHFSIYLYSEIYFFYLSLIKKNLKLFYNSNSRTLVVTSSLINNFFITYWTFLKNVFYAFSRIFFKKLKFRGKGYYIYKNFRNTVAPQFGYSHMIRMYNFRVSLKFVTKTVIFVYGLNIFDIFKTGKCVYDKRPYNIFTGKGVRFSKQIIYKKTGKISTYR
jgi:ribosomal protein L6P/L9E